MQSLMSEVESNYRSFVLTKKEPIAELQCVLYELTHTPTKARILHLANDDPENLFCISFQTHPTKSDGVAHILEHIVLCGSKHYPVKDPFFAMTRRSLHTFMNALTGADFTCYPASSEIPKDFYNLLGVYMDAVFHPLLTPFSFYQEGHRLELEHPEDPHSPLCYKGIVFNEMKGALSSPATRLAEAIGESLFPDLTYGFNSGGDPKVIPELTYEQLKAFHETYYQPSRALFFFYGNLPLKGHLDFLIEHGLDQAKELPPIPRIPLQPRLTTPVHRTLAFPDMEEEGGNAKCYISFAWLTCSICEQQELLALQLLDTMLLETDASPLRRALLQTGLCKQVSSSLDIEMSEAPWVITLRGCRAEDAQNIEYALKHSLQAIVQEEFSMQAIESALHQMEFARSEITGDSAPFGLSLFWRCGLLVQHGGAAENGLMIHSLLQDLHAKVLNDPTYLSQLLQKYLLDNHHQVRIVMQPDPSLAAKEEEEEKQRLAHVASNYTHKERVELNATTEALKQFQSDQETQDLSVLPKLHLTEIPRQVRDYPLQHEKIGCFDIYRHSCFTNQIVYADLLFPLPHIPLEKLPRARLFTRLFAEIGCGGMDYCATLEYMQEHTGGVGAALEISMHVDGPDCYTPLLHVRGKALYRKGEELFRLLQMQLTSLDLSDKTRIHEILKKQHVALESSIASHAMRYAGCLASSSMGGASRLQNLWHGVEYLWHLRHLIEHWEREQEGLWEDLHRFKEQLLHNSQGHMVLACDEKYYQTIKQADFYSLTHLVGRPLDAWRHNIPAIHVPSQGRLIASPVAFTSQIFASPSYLHPDTPLLYLAAHLMENKVLHPRIREQGGAYGSGASNAPMQGQFSFHAYRDPHIVATCLSFNDALTSIAHGHFDGDDLEEAQLERIQDDSPVSPGSRAFLAYRWLMSGKSVTLRERERKAVLTATRQDVSRAVTEHLIPASHHGPIVSFAGRALLEKENHKWEKRGMAPLPLEKV